MDSGTHGSLDMQKQKLHRQDKNELFVRKKGAQYFLRHFTRYSTLGECEIQYVGWVLGRKKAELALFIAGYLVETYQEKWLEQLRMEQHDINEFGSELMNGINKIDTEYRTRIKQFIKQLVMDQLTHLNYRGRSDLEKACHCAQRMFALEGNETDLILFLFIISTYERPEDFFDRKLCSDQFSGRKYLANALGLSQTKAARIISRLQKMGIIENYSRNISLEDDIVCLLQDPNAKEISKRYFKQIKPKRAPLKHHFIDPDVITYLQKLVCHKTESPTHLLFYGPPGTGKTSMAMALAATAKAPIYSVMRDEGNQSENRRNAIIACMNMTNSGSGSVIIADEADNLLNTANAWQFRGETQDKGWLNNLMERPGTRIIWITNTTSGIEDSVLRRFAYTLQFKAFSSRQRVILFDRIVRSNRVKRFFSNDDIEALAKQYCVTAGPMDLAVKKAKETCARSRKEFQRAVRISLDAHQSFIVDKKKVAKRNMPEKAYSLEGLNVSGNMHEMVYQLERLNGMLYCGQSHTANGLTMLFYGPPGTGKTTLANYLGDKLGREVLSRRYSDLQSMWLGEGEKNIRDAFSEAADQEAILIIDEADSMLLSRDRAQRSWEISFTNEFLTQMESFPGLLICTTNRMRDLDSAAIRRFTYKLQFDYLTPKGNIIFYDKMLKPLVGSPVSSVNRKQIERIRFLAPGDFKTIRKQCTLLSDQGLSHQKIIEMLDAEAQIKTEHAGKRAIGF